MTAELWQTFRDSFRSWTGMLLPENMRPPAIETLTRRAREEGISPISYLKRLASDTEARQALIDGLGLGTTWFMRDKEGLRALVDALRKNAPGDRSLWGVGSSGAVLVRPDQHLAWRSDEVDAEGLAHALEQLLCLELS